MNGRVYDPTLGRFLSADPNIQFPGNMQSWNRYSYVLNNPHSYTDPSGFFLKKLFKSVKKLFKKVLSNKVVRLVASIAIFAIPGAQWAAGLGLEAGFFASFTQGFAAGFVGSGGDLRSSLLAGFTAGAFNLAGTHFPGPIENAVAHGAIGGVTNSLAGGDFGAGFIGGAFGSFATPSGGPGFKIAKFIRASVAGGLGAVLGGGKFKNGAITAAFGYAFNEAMHDNRYSDAFFEHAEGMYADVTGAADSAQEYYVNTGNPIGGALAGSLTTDNIGLTSFTLATGGVGGSNIGAARLLVDKIKYAVGPLQQWVRLKGSYSHFLGQRTRLSLSWGASPKNPAYLQQIGSGALRSVNQWLRVQKVPLPGKWFKDPGHLHIRY